MPNRFVERHRANVRSALRHSAMLLLVAAALVALRRGDLGVLRSS